MLNKNITIIILICFTTTCIAIPYGFAEKKSAEILLKGLSENRESMRKIGAVILIPTGVLCLGVALGSSDIEPQSKTTGIGLGALALGFGIWTANTPTPLESDYHKILLMPNSTEAETKEREGRAVKLLEKNANGAFQGRMLSAILNTALTIYYLNMKDPIAPASLGAIILWQLFVKTDVENAWDDYKKGLE